ncbi:Zn-dependent oxidoreductase [Pasteurellaceae bacterium 15-036681]|nr:Zn-dependent oxidoreductase [Pasteurellaceae bacterium 15-036681]
MKAIGFNQPLPIENKDALIDIELPTPELGARDILVAVKAVSVNPVDMKVRGSFQPAEGEYRVLGYDAAGIVQAVGSEVQNFKIGDEVYYAGALTRQGSNAELQAVDERIVALKPKSLSFAEAAALPLTTLTAWETLFDRLDVEKSIVGGANSLLLIGGAGGVGSLAIQLLKQLTDLTVIATASRPESQAWVKQLGADFVIDHRQDLAEQVAKLGIGEPSFVFSTNYTETYVEQIAELIAPQGRLALIDDPENLNIMPLKWKSVSIHWEFMFTRSMSNTVDIARQGEILAKVAELVDTGKLKTTTNHIIQGINAENLRKAHSLIEQGDTIGKIVLADW